VFRIEADQANEESISRGGCRAARHNARCRCGWHLRSDASARSTPQIVEQVLVRVNGDIITKSDLEERQISALRQRNIDPDKLASDEQLKALAEVTPQILVSAVEELLLTQLGREKGLKLSDEMFNRWLANMRKEQKLEDDKRFQDALKQEGMTLTDVRRNVERQFLISEVQRDEFGKLQITEDDARQCTKRISRNSLNRHR
jgi:hypothetical protein